MAVNDADSAAVVAAAAAVRRSHQVPRISRQVSIAAPAGNSQTEAATELTV